MIDEGGEIPDNGLMIEGPPFGLEKIYDYEPGGHHPLDPFTSAMYFTSGTRSSTSWAAAATQTSGSVATLWLIHLNIRLSRLSPPTDLRKTAPSYA